MVVDKPILVLKIGGNQVEDEGFLAGFVQAVKELLAEYAIIVVHGGGKEIGALHQQLGVPFETVEGLRATSEESLRLVEMVLNGTVNTRLVRWLVNGRIDAMGISGLDMAVVRVTPFVHPIRDLGRVGQIARVNAEALLQLLDIGVLPVISPVSLGEDGLAYNVNADHVAVAIARAVEAVRLVFVSNVPGVQIAGRTVRAMLPSQLEELISAGIINGGMIPKVRSAMEAVANGLSQVVITDLDGLSRGEGTRIIREA